MWNVGLYTILCCAVLCKGIGRNMGNGKSRGRGNTTHHTAKHNTTIAGINAVENPDTSEHRIMHLVRDTANTTIFILIFTFVLIQISMRILKLILI